MIYHDINPAALIENTTELLDNSAIISLSTAVKQCVSSF